MSGTVSPWTRRVALHVAMGLDRLFGARVRNTLGILMYHRVTSPVAGVPPPTYNVSPRQFRRQLAGLQARGYRAWPLRTMLEVASRGGPIPPRAFVVTFDDGYECVYTQAFPVLRELGVPATVFLATAFLDRDAPFPFDAWKGAGDARVPAEAWRPLSTAQAAEMLASGLVELGSHTHHHADYRSRPDALAADLQATQAELARRFGLSDATLAFPFGQFDRSLTEGARQAGMLCALTTVNDLVRPGDDPFAWGRLTVFDTDSAAMLAATLSGRYAMVRSLGRIGWTGDKFPFPDQPSVGARGREVRGEGMLRATKPFVKSADMPPSPPAPLPRAPTDGWSGEGSSITSPASED